MKPPPRAPGVPVSEVLILGCLAAVTGALASAWSP